MIYVGIDVAKDKHDCFISNSDGEILYNAFTIQNNREGFDELYQKILFVEVDMSNIKVGLEATGHYNYNLLGYLIDKGLPTYVINPLHTNLYRKSLSLRKTKTDKVDARTVDLQIVVTYFFRFIFTCSFIDYHIIIFILKMFSPCFSRFAPPYFMIKTPFPDRVLPGKGFLEILFANAFDCTG